MAIKFSCACGRTIRVPDDYAGRSVTCPDCGRDAATPGDAPGPVVPVSRRGGRSIRLLAGAVILLLGVALGVMGVRQADRLMSRGEVVAPVAARAPGPVPPAAKPEAPKKFIPPPIAEPAPESKPILPPMPPAEPTILPEPAPVAVPEAVLPPAPPVEKATTPPAVAPPKVPARPGALGPVHAAARAHFLEYADDPASVTFVRWREPAPLAKSSDGQKCEAVVLGTIRARNRAGVLQVHDYLFYLEGGRVFRVVPDTNANGVFLFDVSEAYRRPLPEDPVSKAIRESPGKPPLNPPGGGVKL